MKPIRLVLDTNVYVSAVLNPESVIYTFVQDSAAQHLATYYTSPAILAELQDKLERKLMQPRERVVRWLTALEETVRVVRPRQVVTVLNERDPDDNKILECALEAQADLIITADQDLLSLGRFQHTAIVHTATLKFMFPQLKQIGKP